MKRKREPAEVGPTLAPLPYCCNRGNQGSDISHINKKIIITI